MVDDSASFRSYENITVHFPWDYKQVLSKFYLIGQICGSTHQLYVELQMNCDMYASLLTWA